MVMGLVLLITIWVVDVMELVNYQLAEVSVKAAVSWAILVLSLVGMGVVSYRLFVVFFVKKVVKAANAKHVDKSLEFSAFRNINDF